MEPATGNQLMGTILLTGHEPTYENHLLEKMRWLSSYVT